MSCVGGTGSRNYFSTLIYPYFLQLFFSVILSTVSLQFATVFRDSMNRIFLQMFFLVILPAKVFFCVFLDSIIFVFCFLCKYISLPYSCCCCWPAQVLRAEVYVSCVGGTGSRNCPTHVLIVLNFFFLSLLRR